LSFPIIGCLANTTDIAYGLRSIRLVLSALALEAHSGTHFILILAGRANDAVIVIVLRVCTCGTRLAASYSRECIAVNLALNVGSLPSIAIAAWFTVSDRDSARRAVFAANGYKECGLIKSKR
jgi:hypothetical protein